MYNTTFLLILRVCACACVCVSASRRSKAMALSAATASTWNEGIGGHDETLMYRRDGTITERTGCCRAQGDPQRRLCVTSSSALRVNSAQAQVMLTSTRISDFRKIAMYPHWRINKPWFMAGGLINIRGICRHLAQRTIVV